MKHHSDGDSLKGVPDDLFTWKALEEAEWQLAEDIRLDDILTALGDQNWVPVKAISSRAVYAVGTYYVKIFSYKGIIHRVKRFWLERAKRDWEIGVRLFECCGRTPQPIAFCRAGGFSIFINRSVEPCETLGEFIERRWSHMGHQERYRLVDRFSRFLQDVFRCKLFQTDYNLGNLLINSQNEFFIIDMQRARQRMTESLTADEIASNLSFLLPCFESIERRYKLRFFINLTKNHHELKDKLWTIQADAFQKMRRHWRKKTKRVLVQRSDRENFFHAQAVRGYVSASIQPMIRQYVTSDPERLFDYTETQLKNSKRAKLAIIKLGDQRYFLKRYNVKNWRHRIKRILGRAPARKIWLNNHLFQMRGFSSSHLLATVDVGKGLNYTHSYALYAYLEDATDNVDRINSILTGEKTRNLVMKRLARLAWEMHQKGIHHGDLKISNIIWGNQSKQERIYVIDLDAIKFRRSVGNRQRISDLKNMVSYIWMLDPDPCKTDPLFDAYVGLHAPWHSKRDRLHRLVGKKACRQFKHRRKRIQGPANT